jgi:hypothetical protein
MEAHAAYGTFLLCKQPGDGGSEVVMIRHHDGKAFKSDAQRKQLGLPQRTRRGAEGTAEARATRGDRGVADAT